MTAQSPGDVIRYSAIPLSAEQRSALARLLDEIAFGVATVARAEQEHGTEPGVLRAAKAGCWDSIADEYAQLLEGWGTR